MLLSFSMISRRDLKLLFLIPWYYKLARAKVKRLVCGAADGGYPQGGPSGLFVVGPKRFGHFEGQFLRIMVSFAGGITSVYCLSMHGVDYFLLFFVRRRRRRRRRRRVWTPCLWKSVHVVSKAWPKKDETWWTTRRVKVAGVCTYLPTYLPLPIYLPT